MEKEKYIIAIFATDKIKTGAHKRYLELINGLSRKGYKIVCFSPTDHFNNAIYEYIPVSIRRASFIPITIQLLFQVLRKTNVKMLKNHSKVLIFSGTASIAGIALKKKLKAPLILGVRSSIYEDRKISISNHGIKISKFRTKNKVLTKLYLRIYSRYERLMYDNSDIITVQNFYDRDNVEQNSKHEEIFVIPNNINVEWIENEELKDSNNSKHVEKIGFIGSLIERKGLGPLLTAYSQLIKDGINTELHIAGEGPMKKDIEKLISKEKLKNVYLHGYVSKPMEFLKEMDLTIVPSLIDSFPNVIFESWYVGTPVIGSKVGGISYQLKDKKLLFKENSADEIYWKIKQCLQTGFYNEIRELSKDRRSEFEFDWVERYEKIINSI